LATNIGNQQYPWIVEASVNSSSSQNAKIILQTQAYVVNGYANFTNLGVSDVVTNLVISYSFVLPVGVNS
jgi:hypothetical protein